MGGLGGRPACRGRPHSGSQRGWPARLQGRPRSTTNNTLPDACSMPIRRGSMTRSHPEPRALGGGEARRGSVRCSGRADATSATSPPRCCRRCWQLSAGPDGIHHLACLMCASLLHMGGERERAEADRIWEARAPETCQIRSVAAIPRTAVTGAGVSQLPWPPPRLSSPPPRRFARLSSSAAITLKGERHARQVRGSPDGCEKERE